MSIVHVPSRQGRRSWWELLDLAVSGQADIVVEQDGQPVAILIPFADYRALEEELRRLRSARRNLASLADDARSRSCLPWMSRRRPSVASTRRFERPSKELVDGAIYFTPRHRRRTRHTRV